jgi:uncharacterized membrane protein YfcA
MESARSYGLKVQNAKGQNFNFTMHFFDLLPTGGPFPLLADFQFSGGQWALAALAAACIGMSKAGFSGVGMVNIAVMAAIMPARQSTGVILPMLILADCCAINSFRQHAVWAEIRRVLPAALLGVVAGTLIMHRFSGPDAPSDTVFRRIIGAIILFLTLLQYLRRAQPAWFVKMPSGAPLAWGMGGLTGVTTMLANAAGPVMTIYLLIVRLPKYELVGTAAWIFLLLNLCKLPFSYGLGLIGANSLHLNLCLAPAVVAGVILGKWLLKFVSQRWFEEIALLFAIVASARLLWG